MNISRRSFLIGTAGILTAGVGTLGLVETGVLPGRSGLHQALGLTGPAGTIPDVQPGKVVDGQLVSLARLGRKIEYSIVYPSGVEARLPVCLFLGGRGSNHRTVIDDLGFDRFLAATVANRTPPFALVTVDGGEEYWHRRSSGDDPLRMLVDELLPAVAAAGHPVDRFAVAGLSMGGYGALLLAGTVGAERICAVGAMSAAIFENFESSAPGAFDSVDDFTAHDVLALSPRLSSIPMRIDCGADDPFVGGSEQLLQSLDPRPTGSISPGLHDANFWLRQAPAQLQFIGTALAAC